MDIGAVKYVAGAVGIDHALGRDRKRGHGANRTGLVVPEQTLFALGDAADAAAAALEVIQHLVRRHIHLLAQPLGDDGDVDEFKQFVGVGAQAAAIQRGQDAVLPAQFCVMDRGVRLVAVDMQRAASPEIEHRKRMDMLVVAAAHDRPLAVLRHDERQRRGVDLARMDRDSVFRAHVLEHASQPVIGDGGDQVGHDAELGAAECRGDRVAAERDRVGGSDMLLVAGRHMVGDEGNVDIGLSDEERLHKSVRRG